MGQLVHERRRVEVQGFGNVGRLECDWRVEVQGFWNVGRLECDWRVEVQGFWNVGRLDCGFLGRKDLYNTTAIYRGAVSPSHLYS
jgi:glutamate dehydrogenase/leucine dehydrogenase